MRRILVGLGGVVTLGCAGLGGEEVPADEPLEAPAEEAPAEEPAEEPEAPASRLEPVDLSGERDPECTAADFMESKPLLAAEQPQGRAPVVVQTSKGISETVFMDNGMELRVTRSGCAHYGEVWEAVGGPGGKAGQAMRKIAKHVALADGETSSFLNALKDAPPDVEGEFPCCEICTCSVSREGEVLRGVVDVAL